MESINRVINQVLKLCLSAGFILLLNCGRLMNDEGTRHYTVGFSQCTSGDLWRQTMNGEMIREAALYADIHLIIKDGQHDNEKQTEDIEAFIEQRVDLLIVSPNEAVPITPVVEKAFNSGIPVILIDRKISSDKYTSYIGADNFKIGYEAGNCARRLLHGNGRILEIRGLAGSSPAAERHNGFAASMQQSPDIHVIDAGNGQWLGDVSERLAERIFDETHDIDLVYAHNDVMALGAYKVAQRRGIENIRFLGTDALPGEDGGIQMVLNGWLDATLVYPTGGDVAVQTALSILKDEPFNREIILETVLVDSSNARILKLQTDQLLNHQSKIEAQTQVLNQQLLKIETAQQRLSLAVLALLIVLVIVFYLFRAYRLIKRINIELAEKNEAISQQKEEISFQRDQLFEMNRKVKEVNDMKIQFFTNISHEFRTPLTLISGVLDQFEKKNDLNPRSRKDLWLMHRNTGRLLHLMNQLMDFRKLDEKKMRLRADKHDIVLFLKNVNEAFDVLAEQKNIRFQLKPEMEKCDVWFDEEKLDTVFFNLLSNAFKFTPEGESVTVYVKLNENTEMSFIEIAVQDTGVGVAEHEMSKIFEPFYEVAQPEERHYAGTGIGLALCKSLIELHHGSISVQSSRDRGSRFIVRLPLGNKHLDESELAESYAEPARSSYPAKQNVLFDDNTPGSKKAQASKDSPLVLIVDDHPDMIQFICGFLQNQYRIEEAGNGQQGFEAACRVMPDIIVSDIMMPVMDGIEFCQKLKSDLRTSHIPVILLTARTLEEHQIEGFETGADAYITKPFTAGMLLIRIRNFLEARRHYKEFFSQNLNFYSTENSMRDIDRKFIDKVKAVIEENFLNTNLSVDFLGKQVGLTRVHLYRKIKNLTGYSASEFIRLIRLNKAADMMKGTDLTVAEIAFKSGFETPSYFSKCFREHFKQTPSDYIASHKPSGSIDS